MEQSRVVRLCLLLAVFFALSCTREQKSATVTFTAPKFTQSQKLTYAQVDPTTIRRLSDNTTNFNSLLNPTVTTDLNCFIVFVGGDGFDQAGTCAVSDGSSFKLGAYAGGVLSGGTATVPDVIAGTRTITLVGFHASDTLYCTDFHLGINQSQLSEPFVVAQKKMDIRAGSSPVNVDMTASLTTAKISDCKFASDNGGGSGYFGSGVDGDITSGSGTLSLSSMMDANNQHYLTSVSQVTSIADNGNGTAKITVNQSWNYAAKLNVNDGDEVMLYVSGASPGSPGGCGGIGTNNDTDGVYAGFSYSGIVSGTNKGPSGKTFDLMTNDRRWLNIPAANLTASGVGSVQQTFCHVLAIRVPQINAITLSSGTVFSLVQSNGGFYDLNMADQTIAGILPVRVKSGITLSGGSTLSFIADGGGYAGGTSAAKVGQSAFGRLNLTATTLNSLDQGGGVDSSATGCGGGHGGIGGCEETISAGNVQGDQYGCGSSSPDVSMSCLLGKFFFGGGGGGTNAGHGGGALRIYASQISLLDSASVLSFSAMGNAASGTLDGGGAGGSILVTTNAIQGVSGSTLGFKATGGLGGNGTGGNGGGGGRIQLVTQTSTNWQGTLSADVSGGAGHLAGGPGTCLSTGLALACALDP